MILQVKKNILGVAIRLLGIIINIISDLKKSFKKSFRCGPQKKKFSIQILLKKNLADQKMPAQSRISTGHCLTIYKSVDNFLRSITNISIVKYLKSNQQCQ